MDERWVNWLRHRPEWLMLAIGVFIILAVLAFGLTASGEEDDSAADHATSAADAQAEH